MNPVTAEVLRAVAPRFSGDAAKRQADIIEAIAGDFSSILNEYEINTELRVAHFLAQIVHETAGLRTTEEFASGDAYDTRTDLGNTPQRDGDGRKYKGRGLLMLTGAGNYRHYGPRLGIDLVNHPELAAEPLTSLRIACLYWQEHNINPLCDADNLEGVTHRVNGGLNGLADRRQYLAKAKQALAALVAVPAEVEASPEAPSEPFVIPAADGPDPTLADLHAEANKALKNTSILYNTNRSLAQTVLAAIVAAWSFAREHFFEIALVGCIAVGIFVVWRARQRTQHIAGGKQA